MFENAPPLHIVLVKTDQAMKWFGPFIGMLTYFSLLLDFKNQKNTGQKNGYSRRDQWDKYRINIPRI